MSTLDIAYIGIMVVSLAVSSFRGGVRELFSVASVVAGFIVASRFYPLASKHLIRFTSHPEVNDTISFLALFILTAMLVGYAGGQLTEMLKKAKLGFWNLMAGSAIGALKGLLVCALITYALVVFMPPDSKAFKDSKGFPYALMLTEAAAPVGPRHFKEALAQKLEELKGKGSDKEKGAVKDGGNSASGGKREGGADKTEQRPPLP